MKHLVAILAIAAVGCAGGPRPDTGSKKWHDLPWQQWRPLAGEWSAERDEIVGRAGGETALLRTEDEFADFVLDLQFQATAPASGGLQFRSHWLPILPPKEGVLPEDLPRQAYGYRAVVDTHTPVATGALIDANGEGTLATPSPKKHGRVKPTGWNRMRVRAIGPRIEVSVNDKQVCAIDDERMLSGFVALHVAPFAGDEVPPTGTEMAEVRFRNIRIRDLGRAGKWRPLFNGKNLEGWRNWGDEEFVIENGAIVGRSGPKKSEGYLCTRESWEDFRVRGRFKMLGEGNFGLFYHSTITLRDDGYPIIAGVQGEVMPSCPGSTGWHYESYKRGWLVQPDTSTVGAWALRPNQWNEIEIRSAGNHVTSWVNGIRVTDFVDDGQQLFEGGFALQLHAGGVDGIAWKDLYVARDAEP